MVVDREVKFVLISLAWSMKASEKRINGVSRLFAVVCVEITAES